MSDMVTSRLAGFHKLPLEERQGQIARMFRLSAEERTALTGDAALEIGVANQMIENAVGTFSLPLGLGLNMRVNGRDVIVPMAVEEPSVRRASTISPLRFSIIRCPMWQSLASLPAPLRNKRASGSVVEECVSFLRFSPWKSRSALRP